MIRVFVGCAANGEDAESQAVLEYTLRGHASQPVEIVWMRQARKGFWAGWNTQGWATPFTGFRWGVPWFCGYEGRAVYMDSDMIVRADIAELWDQPMKPGTLALVRQTDGKLRTCVMLLDCGAIGACAEWPSIDAQRRTPNQHGMMMEWLARRRHMLGAFAGQWNCIDLKRATGLDDPTVKIVHYSSMPHQPHLKHAVPRLAANGLKHWYDGRTAPHWRPELEQLFDALLAEASAAGYVPANYEPDEPFGAYVKKSFKNRPLAVRT